jgi:hypothetical protein
MFFGHLSAIIIFELDEHQQFAPGKTAILLLEPG